MLQYRRKEPVRFHWPMVLLAVLLAAGIGWVLYSTLPRYGESVEIPDQGPWLAVIGQDTIFTREFRWRYETSPHVGQGDQARLDFLEALALERLFAYAAVEKGWDTLATVRRMQEELEAEARVEEFLREEVERRVKLDTSEVTTHFLRAIRDIKLDAWICQDSATAEAVMTQLSHGVPFREAGKTQALGKAILIQEQPLQWNTTSEAFEDSAFQLGQGEIVGPVEGEGGWYVLRNVGFEMHRIPSEAAFAEFGPWVRDVLKGRKVRTETHAFIRESMKGARMNIAPEPFEAVASYLYGNLPKDNRITDFAPPMFAGTNEVVQPGQALDDMPSLHPNQPMVVIHGPDGEITWTVRETLEKLQTSPQPLPWNENRAAFAATLRDAIIWRIEFDHLDKLACDHGFDANARVAVNTAIWNRHVLSLEAAQRITEVLGVKDSNISARKTDKLVLKWIDEQVKARGGVKFNTRVLDTMDVMDMSVFYRKRHFPNRPATPSPATYTWAVQWEPR